MLSHWHSNIQCVSPLLIPAMSAHARASNALIIIWVPTYVGFTVAAASYGATIGQLVYYVRAFPRDKLLVRILVFTVFIFNTTHMFLMTSVVYRVFIHCRMESASSSCLVYSPWWVSELSLVVSYRGSCIYPPGL
ncbi:hypothetical protein BDN67DRAFT_105879 [Paxillus ammoniavirescens]|nr:hypothetical protein BDN67DRAFT_105879 [Paxillus ammoniavirescens]